MLNKRCRDGSHLSPTGQWFEEVEHAARAAFVVHVGGSIDDEHGGWARLFQRAAESVAKDHAERRAPREVIKGLPDRSRHLLARQDKTVYIHLTQARVMAAGISPLLLPGFTGEDGSPRSRSG